MVDPRSGQFESEEDGDAIWRTHPMLIRANLSLLGCQEPYYENQGLVADMVSRCANPLCDRSFQQTVY